MNIHPIRNERDHAKALRQIEKLWGAAIGTPQADTLEMLVTLIDAYEAKHHPIDPPDPVTAIRFHMEQLGIVRADLEPLIGTRARVSEVLNRRRPLSIEMIKCLRDELGISADVLIGPSRSRPKPSKAKGGRRTAAPEAVSENSVAFRPAHNPLQG